MIIQSFFKWIGAILSESVRLLAGKRRRKAKVYKCGRVGHNFKVSKKEKYCPLCNHFKIKSKLYFSHLENWLT